VISRCRLALFRRYDARRRLLRLRRRFRDALPPLPFYTLCHYSAAPFLITPLLYITPLYATPLRHAARFHAVLLRFDVAAFTPSVVATPLRRLRAFLSLLIISADAAAYFAAEFHFALIFTSYTP